MSNLGFVVLIRAISTISGEFALLAFLESIHAAPMLGAPMSDFGLFAFSCACAGFAVGAWTLPTEILRDEQAASLKQEPR